MKLHGANELTYNGNIVYNKENLTKMSQLENDIEVEGLEGPAKLQAVIDLHIKKIMELDEAIKNANSLSLMLASKIAMLENIEKNRIAF